MNLNYLRALATVTTNQSGKKVVQIPLDAWQEYLASNDLASEPLSPAQRLLLLQDEWSRHPEENMSDEWWDDFMRFVKQVSQRSQYLAPTDEEVEALKAQK